MDDMLALRKHEVNDLQEKWSEKERHLQDLKAMEGEVSRDNEELRMKKGEVSNDNKELRVKKEVMEARIRSLTTDIESAQYQNGVLSITKN